MNFDIHQWLRALQSTGTKYFLFSGIAFLIFYILFSNAFRSIRIQRAFPGNKDYYRDILYSVLSMTIFATISYFVFTALRPYNHIHLLWVGDRIWHCIFLPQFLSGCCFFARYLFLLDASADAFAGILQTCAQSPSSIHQSLALDGVCIPSA